MPLRLIAGLVAVVAAGWANAALRDRWLRAFGVDPHNLELGEIFVDLAVLAVPFAGAVWWTTVLRFDRAGDGAKQVRLLLKTIAMIFIVGFFVTGCVGSNV
jgi:hypothetical protein